MIIALSTISIVVIISPTITIEVEEITVISIEEKVAGRNINRVNARKHMTPSKQIRQHMLISMFKKIRIINSINVVVLIKGVVQITTGVVVEVIDKNFK